MKIHNTRSPEQWTIISRHVDFKGKTVLDLGCGKGDILFRAFDAGAKVVGLDCDKENIDHIRSIQPGIEVTQANIDFFKPQEQVDIAICFSVLPYLIYPERALYWMEQHSVIAFVECQYASDGPGFSWIAGNDDMEAWLLEAGQFEKVEVIGHTFVEGRNKYRFIWKCE